MNTRRFEELLPSLYEDFPRSLHPKDRRFQILMDDIPGGASENNLALLNLAASLLPPSEAYVEVGAWKGLSIIGAAFGNEARSFYTIENFHGFGAPRKVALGDLRGNLERWNVAEVVTLVEQDAFRALKRSNWLPGPIGVFFYDGSHDRLAHYLALGTVEPLLADEALVIIDDASWRVVERASDHYVSRHPGYRLLFELRSEQQSDPRWWNGLRVYSYRRSGNAQSDLRLDVEWRRLAYLYAYEPVNRFLIRSAVMALSKNPRLLAAVHSRWSVLDRWWKGRPGPGTGG